MTPRAPHPAAQRQAGTPTAAGPPARRPGGRGPLRRVVAGSLLTGAVLGAALPLLVSGGASESVVTGSALVGFAVGWAVLALVSTRTTSEPQRWAWVPAAGLGATGLGLLVTTPGNRALTAAGWLWPPLLLALAVWAATRVHRSVGAGGGPWLLHAVVAVMAVVAVGGAVETVGSAGDRSVAAPGQLYDVGGRRLHLDCTGSGGPTVILTSGLGNFSVNWARVAPAVAGTTRVCTYDRAGQGWSDDAPGPQDGLAAAADLHAALDRAGERGPFVLVGHSIGGDHAMTYAARHPDQVAGMVLLDTTNPYRATDGGAAPAGPPGSLAVLPSLSRTGIGRLLPASFWSSLPEPAAGRFRAFTSGPRGARSTIDEFTSLPALLDQARALTSLGGAPLVVLTAAGHESDAVWNAAQERMAALSTNSSHRVADVGHTGLLEEERGAQQSARAITDVVAAVRNGRPLPRL